MFKLSIHQAIMACWLIGAQVVFPPVIHSATRADAGAVIAWGVVFVALQILCAPMLLRWQAFRRWYGWTDALSQRQRQALVLRNLHCYYRAGFNDGYTARVMPYAWRITWTACALVVVGTVLPSGTDWPIVDALAEFSSLYPLGVLALIIASCPMASAWKSKA